MIEIRLVSQPQALTELQGEQLVELHLDYLANQRALLKEVKPGPVIQITPQHLLENNVVAAAFDLDKINLSSVERIEIVRGAASAQYGADAESGVINIITKKSEKKSC